MAVSNAWVAQRARHYGLDPRAVFAIGHHESGNRDNAVGDGGTSFGRWQLHVGGALPAGKGAAWAGSKAGVDYALQHMSTVARGLTGRAAVSNISRRFERPADPTSEIADAMNFYKSQGGIPKGSGAKLSPSVGPRGNEGRGTGGARQALLQGLMQANQQYATTGQFDPAIVTGAMIAARGAATPLNAGARGAAAPGGSLGRTSGAATSAILAAKSAIGRPYVWGGESKAGGFDCSGLIQWAYRKAGVSIGRTTYDQIKAGHKVAWGSFRPGDLIFSDFEGTGKPTHEVMYIGHGKVIAAPHTGTNVQVQNVQIFRNNFIGARRVL